MNQRGVARPLPGKTHPLKTNFYSMTPPYDILATPHSGLSWIVWTIDLMRKNACAIYSPLKM